MRRLLPMVLLLAACGSDAAVETTVPVEPSSTTSTTSTTVETTTEVESTTTSAVGEAPVGLCRRGLPLVPGVVYEADCFLEPVSFIVKEHGWSSAPAAEDWVTVTFTSDADGTMVGVALVWVDFTDPPEDVLTAILAKEGIDATGGITPTEVAGSMGVFADVQGAPRGGDPAALDQPRPSHACPSPRPVRYKDGGNTIVGQVGFADEIGVGFCHEARIWAVQIGERTMTVIGGTGEPGRHEEAVAKVEELLDGMSFEAAQS